MTLSADTLALLRRASRRECAARPRSFLELRKRRFVLVFFYLIDLLLVGGLPAKCQIPTLSSWQYDHSRWLGRNGAPAVAECFAQTADGFLWIGSPEGLYQFDGVTFEKFKPVSSPTLVSDNVSTLYVSQNGDLWVGHREGGISRIRNGQVERFEAASGLPPSAAVLHFAQDARGIMWAATWSGLFQLHGELWSRVGPESGYTGRLAQEVGLDRNGSLWVLSGEEMFYRPRGTYRFLVAGPQRGAAGFARDADGFVVLEKPLLRAGGTLSSSSVPYVNNSVLGGETPAYLFASDNSLWAIRDGEGLYRISNAEKQVGAFFPTAKNVQSFTKKDGLTSGLIHAVFEDREHNIWVGTETGIDRFSPTRFERMSNISGSVDRTLVRGDHKSIFLTSSSQSALRIDENGTAKIVSELGTQITASYRSPGGTQWFGGPLGLTRLQEGQINRYPPPMPTRRPVDNVQAITGDQTGVLWVSISHEGLFRFSDGVWTPVREGFDAPPSYPSSLFCDSSASLWLGYRDYVLKIVVPTEIAPPVRLPAPIGTVRSFAESGGTIWTAGSRGLAFLRGGTFQKVLTDTDLPIERVASMVFSASGDLWMNGNPGVVRIAKKELQRVLADPTYAPQFEVFDLMAQVTGSTPPAGDALRDESDHLWFVVADEVFRLPNGALPPGAASSAPPTVIRDVLVDDVATRNNDTVILPSGSSRLQISYAAMTLVGADNVLFRYRIEGLDNHWQDAGHRRDIVYERLPPGNHRFTVCARRPGGTWSTGSSIEIFVRPSFTQTRLFLVFFLTAVSGLIYLLYALRLRQVRAAYQMRSRVQTAERERIARELHDTLLQGIQGLTLRLGYVLERLPSESRLRADLDQTIGRTEALALEGRRRVRDLRGGYVPGKLAEALAHCGQEFSRTSNIEFQQIVLGEAKHLDAAVEQEIYGIAREAMTNAFQHSLGTCINLELVFGPKSLELRVIDNGQGIDSSRLQGQVETVPHMEHWGLVGMRERAAGIGATLVIQSDGVNGTKVELQVPARTAYSRVRRLFRFF